MWAFSGGKKRKTFRLITRYQKAARAKWIDDQEKPVKKRRVESNFLGHKNLVGLFADSTARGPILSPV